MHTEKDQANNGGTHIRGTGHRLRKKYVINATRAAFPDGKESLSGERLSLVVGRLLLVSAFNTAVKIMSRNKPEIHAIFHFNDFFHFNSQMLLFLF